MNGSSLGLIAVLGVALALGLLQLRHLMFPPAPDLVAEIEQWRRGRERATSRAGVEEPVSPLGRVSRWLAETLRAYRPEALETITPDLAITGRDLQGWLSKVVATAAAFVIAPTALTVLRRLRGDDVALQWGPLIGIALGVAAVGLSVKDLRTQANRRREEFTRAMSIYLDLVAMSMEAGQGHAQALPAAAQIGTGPVFTEIRNAIEIAPSKGISAWEALGQMGERYRLPALVSLRSSIELAQDDGARVKASLIARADTMRSTRLAGALERANNATATMRQLTLAAAVLAAVYICAPYILALRGGA